MLWKNEVYGILVFHGITVLFWLQVKEVSVTYKFKIKLNAYGNTGIDCKIAFVENLLRSFWDAEVLSCLFPQADSVKMGSEMLCFTSAEFWNFHDMVIVI